MLQAKKFLVFSAILLALIYQILAAPPIKTSNMANSNDTQFLHPHIITIERLESLLRRAGEIFRPVLTAPIIQKELTERLEEQQEPVPYQELQPPTSHPYNFYLPPFDQGEEYSAKLDEKSKNMEKFTPPPLSKEGEQTNYYAEKPKKLPKKFNATEKLINIKWLNAFEREALADSNGQLPKAVYLANEERNRINFDDSFFAVDMHVRMPADNNPHKETKIINGPDGEQDFVNQGEDGEDLVAAPAAHLAQISNFDLEARKKM